MISFCSYYVYAILKKKKFSTQTALHLLLHALPGDHAPLRSLHGSYSYHCTQPPSHNTVSVGLKQNEGQHLLSKKN